MLKLEKGNKDNLEGKVFIYSMLKEGAELPKMCGGCGNSYDLSNVRVFGLYVSTDKKDYEETTGETVPDNSDVLREIVTRVITEIMDQDHFGQDIETNIEEVRFYRATMNLPDKSKLPMHADVLFAGEYDNLLTCMEQNENGVNFYFGALREQMGKDFANKKQQKVKKEFKSFKSDDTLRTYITETYVNPLLEAKKNDKSEDFRNLKKAFLVSGRKSKTMTDVSYLCQLVQNNEFATKESKELKNALVDKIVYKSLEQYEKLTSLVKEIDDLKTKIS